MDRNNSLHTAIITLIYAIGVILTVMCAFGFPLLPSDMGANQIGNQPMMAGLSAVEPVVYPVALP
jgi:hypothetical protein